MKTLLQNRVDKSDRLDNQPLYHSSVVPAESDNLRVCPRFEQCEQ